MPTDTLLAHSEAALAKGLPEVQPIALISRTDPFNDAGWVFEPHYEGLRALLYGSALGCEVRCSPELPMPRMADLRARVSEVLQQREAILDGQIVSLNRQGKPVFENLLRGDGYLAFAAFDLLWLDGVDLRKRSLSERKESLSGLLPVDTGPLYKILTIEEYGQALFNAVKKMDLEGIVAKCKDDAYTPDTRWYTISTRGSAKHGWAEVVRPRGRYRVLDADL